MIQFLQKPSKTLTTINRWLPPTLVLWLALFIPGLWLALAWSPVDYLQGETVRLMYIHVPASWGALMTYFAMAIVSAYAFIKQVPLAHLITRAMAPIGLLLCITSLVTGSIWGKPTWGTWWVWDARLTSMLVLALLYVSYMVVATTVRPEQQALKNGAIIALIGSINLPIIKWSVEWWSTLHQPASIMRFAKPAMHWQMLTPLLVMAFALAALCFALFLLQLKALIQQQQLRSTLLRGHHG